MLRPVYGKRVVQLPAASRLLLGDSRSHVCAVRRHLPSSLAPAPEGRVAAPSNGVASVGGRRDYRSYRYWDDRFCSGRSPWNLNPNAATGRRQGKRSDGDLEPRWDNDDDDSRPKSIG